MNEKYTGHCACGQVRYGFPPGFVSAVDAMLAKT
jgi:hypothetical protein